MCMSSVESVSYGSLLVDPYPLIINHADESIWTCTMDIAAHTEWRWKYTDGSVKDQRSDNCVVMFCKLFRCVFPESSEVEYKVRVCHHDTYIKGKTS